MRTAETTSVMARTDCGGAVLVLEQARVGGVDVAVHVVGRERRELVLRGGPARGRRGLGGGEDDERAVAAAW